jgi:PAS domain S-box-containing protein
MTGTFPYEAGVRLRFFSSFLLVSVFSFYIEALRQRAYEDMVREKERAQEYFDIAGAILIVLDADGIVRLINRKGCEVTGYGEEEITGSDWFDRFIPNRIREDVRVVFSSLVAGTAEVGEFFENVIMNKDGEERLIAWRNTVIRDESGKIVGTLSSGSDITERSQFEREREDLIGNLQTALKEIKTLKGIIPICSHCKKVRDDQGFWNQVEAYISTNTDAEFSHGVCPGCVKEHYPEHQDLITEA